MRKIGYIIISFLLTVSCSNENILIEKQKFNDDWDFTILQDGGNDSNFFQSDFDANDWLKVQLPHTPKLEPKIVNNQWQGICWYRKKFSLLDNMKNKKLFLKFEGAMNIAEVWVNGEKLIEHHGGYLPFVVDFSEVAHFEKENTVAIRLNNNDNPVTGPKPLKVLDFNTYGGMYRNVWLIAKHKVHITDPMLANKTASGGIFVTYPEVSKESATVKIQTHIENASEVSTSLTVKNTLIYKDSIVASVESNSKTFAEFEDNTILANIDVTSPHLWSPQAPNLYQLNTEVIADGVVFDKEVTTIGIKSVEFINQELHLNGEKTFLRGVNRHQEYPYIGYALSDNANYRDAKKIKEAGFDYVRLSHYPQSPAFMRACDELGLITIDAILGWQYFSEDEKFQNHIFQTSRDLIRRDRNHASVLAWEVSLNESWMPESFIDELTKIAHEEYPSHQCYTAGWQSYGYDIYLQARQHRLEHYDPKIKKPYNVSEYGDWEYYAMNAGLNQDTWGNLLQEDRSSRQLRSDGESRLLQQATNVQEAHNDNLSTSAFADGYWVMYDYNRGYANDLEASGIMDIFRLPKPAYYFYKSQRDANDPFGQPMIHIANNWASNSPLDVRVFSNCDEVELFLNGKIIGRQKPDNNRFSNHLNHPPFTFKIKNYEKGVLKAHGYINNKLVVDTEIKSPEQPSSITLVIDESDKNPKANCNDILFVHAQIVDKNETVIPTAVHRIQFKIEGDAKILGDKEVVAEAGIASVLLQIGKNSGKIKIKAFSENMTTETSITVKEK